VTKEQLLAEVEDILRTVPSREQFEQRTEDSISWVGRAAAVIIRWDNVRSITVDAAVNDINRGLDPVRNLQGRFKMTSLLQQARADLRLDVGPLSVVIDKGLCDTHTRRSASSTSTALANARATRWDLAAS
jgi:hypothetical protein